MEPQWSLLNVDESVPKHRPSLAEQTYDALKNWIVRGDLEAGATLSENDLARRFSISRSPLREAIRRLQEEGLLDSSGPRGFSVPPLTTDLVKQVYGVRRALETAAASTAIITRAEIDGMSERLIEVKQAMDRGDTTPFNESDIPFHDLFIHNCGNPLLVTHIERLRGNIRRIINYAGQFPGHIQASYDEHLLILDAMGSGDQELLARSVHQHITGVTDRLVAHLGD